MGCGYFYKAPFAVTVSALEGLAVSFYFNIYSSTWTFWSSAQIDVVQHVFRNL